MGYALTYPSKYYVPADDSVIENTVVTSANYTAPTKAKAFVLTNEIHPQSRFRFVFEIGNSADWVEGRVYKNNVAVGTLYRATGTGAGNYNTYTEDVDVGNWTVGDEISLYVNRWGDVNARCRLFRVAGTGSDWVKTLPV